MTDALTHRQSQYVKHRARGVPPQEAARLAGYSPSVARSAAHKLGKNPAVEKAIASIAAEGRKIAVYGLVEAMQEANDAAAFARLNKNSMALVKATELRAKLSGLLIDRVELAVVDIGAAIARAEARVTQINAVRSDGVTGSIDWRPHISGDIEPPPSAA